MRELLRLIKVRISNWRKTHSRWPKPAGLTETPVYLLIEERGFFFPYLRLKRHIAQVFLPLFMLHYFSMSWNAMFLIPLTLYYVIHFIINSLHNITLCHCLFFTFQNLNLFKMQQTLNWGVETQSSQAVIQPGFLTKTCSWRTRFLHHCPRRSSLKDLAASMAETQW